jgi:putative heme degradation protein
MRTKAKVRAYREQNPDATVRDIQKALDISSPSVVQFHLTVDAKADQIALLRSALDACATQLAQCLGPDTEAGRQAREALDATSQQ